MNPTRTNDPARLTEELISLGMAPGVSKYLVTTRPGVVLSQLTYHDHHTDKTAAALRQRIEENAPAPATWVQSQITEKENGRRETAKRIVQEYRDGKRSGSVSLTAVFLAIEQGLPEPIRRLPDTSEMKRRTVDAIAVERIFNNL